MFALLTDGFALRFLENIEITFMQPCLADLCDVEKQVIPQYCVLNPSGTNVIPSVFIIDMWGIIRWKHVDDGTGIVSGDTIIEKLQTEVPLSVTLASLTAFSATDSVTIKWSTETEIVGKIRLPARIACGRGESFNVHDDKLRKQKEIHRRCRLLEVQQLFSVLPY